MAGFPDHAQFDNIVLIEEMYARYLTDPESVDPTWRHFFEGVDFATAMPRKGGPAEAGAGDSSLRIHGLITAYRQHGHLLAKVNPVDLHPVDSVPELSLAVLGFSEQELDRPFPSCGLCTTEQAPLREIIAALRAIYCDRIGFDTIGIEDPAMQRWLLERIEPKLTIDLSLEEKKFLLEYLNKSEAFETFVHTKYVGQKRFSLEGTETLIPMLAEIIATGANLGMEEFVLGMAHRGRLNVLTNILGKPYSVVFQEFEDNILPHLFEGSGDVKYHKGFSSDIKTREGKTVHLHLPANSSCLETVDAIALGFARGKQVLAQDEQGNKIGAIVMHGEAAFTGQGIVYETMEFMNLPGYSTGGTIHIIINNQVGFTTPSEEGRSTRYCTDIARAFGCPVFHVNAEDPESCLFIAQLAIAFRLRFHRDVLIDLNCYRKYGHNEGDEPLFTQPLLYQMIRAKKSIRELYLEQLVAKNILDRKLAEDMDANFRKTLDTALARGKQAEPHPPEERYGITYVKQPPVETLFETLATGAKQEALEKAAKAYCTIPGGFHLHPKLQKFVQDRWQMLQGKVDWGMGECLAFGTLLLDGVPIRLSGQDVQRATFSQRHSVWHDQENDARHCPYAALGKFDVFNSILSEYAILGFEYGYTWAAPNALVFWEAQFGDFSIGGQIIFDHYICSAELKWARPSSLVLLLPHGYEGQGPEHSSGRIERYLQLAAQNNIIVAYPSTPSQYFHLLRRQGLQKIKKPLVVFTPKSMLRLPACTSPIQEFSTGSFQEILDDPTASKNPDRLLLCSGKVYYDLLVERETRKKNVAIVRIEQFYPFHEKKIGALLAKYKVHDVRWVQEEPQNMGAYEFIAPYLAPLLPKGATFRYVGRRASPVTATGSFRQHQQELKEFMNEAFNGPLS